MEQELNMKTKMIQTGLRIPETLYNEFRETQKQTGISINQQALFLIDVGRRAIRLGVQVQGHYPAHSAVCTDAQDAQPGC